jgi:hypothetical protein
MPDQPNEVRRLSDGQFTMLSNAALRDARLSYRARGILAAALSHADGFNLTRRWLDSHGTEGRDAITVAISELRALGYVADSYGSGKAPDRRLIWTDEPATGPAPTCNGFSVALKTRPTENPSDGKSVALKTRPTENPSHIKKTISKEDQENQEDQPKEGASRENDEPAPKDPLRLKTLPAWAVPSDLLDCQQLLAEFWACKKGTRSQAVFSRVCNKLRQWAPDGRRQSLETAIANGWGDVFKPRPEHSYQPARKSLPELGAEMSAMPSLF